VIVGSAFVKRLAEGNPIEGLQAVEQLCRELKAAITPASLQQVGSAR
jgi:tryptophan synthase alpha chain